MEPGRRAVVPADHEQLSAAGGGGLALKLVYEELHRRLIQRQVLHADETTLQVLKLEGRTARSKCYRWLYHISGGREVPHCAVPTQKAENAAAFLEGFSG